MKSRTSTFHEYRIPGYTNPAVQVGLDRLYVDIVQRLGPATRICDLGCGNGRLAVVLASLRYDVLGVDGSQTDIDLAVHHATQGNCRFRCLEIDESLPTTLQNGTEKPFDIVIASDVIEHLYSPRILVECAHRLLRPDGIFIVGTPYHGYLKNLALSVTGKWDGHHGVHWEGGHIKFFSVRTLNALVERSGFDVNAMRYFGRVPYLWKNMICIARKV